MASARPNSGASAARLLLAGQVAERHEGLAQLPLRERVEGIRLVLVLIPRAQEFVSAAEFIESDAGVVTCGEIVRAEVLRVAKQFVELDAAVALDAGIRGPATAVLRHELVDHLFRKVVAKVEHVVRDADLRRRPPRILDRAEGAAAAVLALLGVLLPDLQRDANDVVALLLQERRGHCAIDAAAHRGDNGSFGHEMDLFVSVR